MSARITNLSNEPKEKNRQLLELMRKKLSKIESLAEYTDKLAKWTSDSRAYYDDVKETIIQLLERALITLKSGLRLDPRASFNVHYHLNQDGYIGHCIRAYENVVQTVYRFRDKFPRDGLHLHSRLQAMYMTTTPPDNIIDLDAISPSDSIFLVQHAGPASSVDHPVLINPKSSSSHHTQRAIMSSLPVPAPLAAPSSLQNDVTSLMTSSSSMLPIANTDSPMTDFTPPLVSLPFYTAASGEPSLVSPTSLPPVSNSVSLATPERWQSDESTSALTKPPKKKRKKLNFSEMLDLDQADQVEGHTELQTPTASNIDCIPKVVEAGAPDSSIAPSLSADLVMSIPNVQRAIKRARSDSSSSFSNRAHTPNFLDQALISQSSAPIDPTNDVASALETRTIEESAAIAEQLPPEKSSVIHSQEPSDIHSATETVGNPIKFKGKQSTDAEDTVDVDSKPAKDTVSEDIMSTTDDIMQVGGLDRLPTISDEIEVSLIASDALLTTITGDIETKCRKVSLPDFPGFSKTVTTQSQVGLEKTAQITMRFPVGRAQFLSVENWNKRKVYPIPEDRCNTLCFSLGCYLRADVDRNHKNYNALRSRWPKGQQLHLTVTRRDGSSKRIPLSLPTVCTPDGLVDLGLFIRQGDNTIKISQRGDLSAYVFCLHVHEPTLAQIQRLNKVLNDDLEWGLWRKLVSRPLDLPGSLFAVSQC